MGKTGMSKDMVSAIITRADTGRCSRSSRPIPFSYPGLRSRVLDNLDQRWPETHKRLAARDEDEEEVTTWDATSLRTDPYIQAYKLKMQGPCSAVQVCSCPFDKLLYEHYHAPSFEPESLYRIASVSKVLGMHATLAVLKNRGASYFVARLANDLLDQAQARHNYSRPPSSGRPRPGAPCSPFGHTAHLALSLEPAAPGDTPSGPHRSRPCPRPPHVPSSSSSSSSSSTMAAQVRGRPDLSTKQGPLSGYQTLLSLSPEHGIGYAAFAVDGRGRGGDGDFEKTLRRELERGTES
ncbi:hypothetical protein L209DRAFT_804853 [Thermothelomyces heterothallicus CBS 203.75]